MLCMKQKKELEILYNTDIIMTEERIKIGLRIFSEGKESWEKKKERILEKLIRKGEKFIRDSIKNWENKKK